MQLTLIRGDIKAIDKSSIKRKVCHRLKAFNFMITIYLNNVIFFLAKNFPTSPSSNKKQL